MLFQKVGVNVVKIGLVFIKGKIVEAQYLLLLNGPDMPIDGSGLLGDFLEAIVSVLTFGLVGDKIFLTSTAPEAEKLLALPPHAVNYTKAALNTAIRQMTGAAFESSLGHEVYTMRMDDFKEATAAFVEKRPGEFKGT